MAQGVAWIGGTGNFNDPSNWSSDSETSAPALEGSGASGRFGTGKFTVDEGTSLT